VEPSTLKRISLALMIAVITGMLLVVAALAAEKSTVSAEQAEKLLKEGSQRFIKSYCGKNPKQGNKCLADVNMSQAPFAVVVACSDSRVPPELLFDRGLGDLFIIRLAGNIVNDAALGSIEYAVEHLGVPLVVVMGHKRCGAVQAAVEAVNKNEKVPEHLSAIVNAIKPAVEQVKGQPGDEVDNAVRANIKLVVAKIKAAKPIIAPAVKAGKVRVLGAYFDLDDGRVTFFH
jgi:carbonic anhydrase